MSMSRVSITSSDFSKLMTTLANPLLALPPKNLPTPKEALQMERRTEAEEKVELVDAVHVEEETVPGKKVAEAPIASMTNDKEN